MRPHGKSLLVSDWFYFHCQNNQLQYKLHTGMLQLSNALELYQSFQFYLGLSESVGHRAHFPPKETQRALEINIKSKSSADLICLRKQKQEIGCSKLFIQVLEWKTKVQ